MRIGTAIDVHRFSEPDFAVPTKTPSLPIDTNAAFLESSEILQSAETLKLGLVEFVDYPALAGHSDGDVAAHAIADAMLLAAGLPDLGGTFGVDKPEMVNASGESILREVLKCVAANGFAPESISAQIVAKRPRLLDALPTMKSRLSELLKCPVNVSATTTDGQIPDIGDGMAVMCIASALLR